MFKQINHLSPSDFMVNNHYTALLKNCHKTVGYSNSCLKTNKQQQQQNHTHTHNYTYTKKNIFQIYQEKHNCNCILVSLNSRFSSLVKQLDME